MRGLAIDTSVAVNILNADKSIISKVFQFYPIYLPIVVVGELLFGAKNSGKSEKNIKKYINFINECLILNTTKTIADNYSEIRHSLKKIGKPIPENDLWIAAICKSYELPLMTMDKHFKYIEDINIIEWKRISC